VAQGFLLKPPNLAISISFFHVNDQNSQSLGPWLGPPFYTSKGLGFKCQAALCGGYARWRREPRYPPCRLARRTDGTRPASLISLYFPGTRNDVFCLPTAMGFLSVPSMHVPGAGHESFVAGGACHALIPDDSGVASCTPLTVPSSGKESSLASLLPPGKGICQLHFPPTKGGALSSA
jgi:hypothetical protein